MLAVDRPALGVYVHIPFCAAICQYCNFTRGLLDDSLLVRYVDAVVRDVERTGEGEPVDSLYFGGGTPSLLDGASVARIVDACRRRFELDPHAEITLEANPESTSVEQAEAWRAAGVNRLSIGVQSFRDDELQRLGRLHSSAGAVRAYETARRAGFDNISLDLMMWLPAQTIVAWLESVDRLAALGPDHASLYLLEVYPNAPLRDSMARGHWSQAPDDDAADMYEAAMSRLEAAGFEHYEISNVARAGRYARHNLKYWTDGDWLAFGSGAHGTRRDVRWRNVSGTEDYISRVAAGVSAAADTAARSDEERLQEALFMGLRLARGVDLPALGARYGVDVWGRYGATLFPFVDSGHVRYDGTRLQLTRTGMLVANEILSAFV